MIYDISLPISGSLTVWPGDPAVHISHPQHLDHGDAYTVSRLEMSTHTGTHVDAPAHVIHGGRTIDEIDLDLLVGPARVVHAPQASLLTASVLQALGIPAGTKRLLLRTRNSLLWKRAEADFDPDFVALSGDGAQWLVDAGVRLIGVDYLSVGPYADPTPAHLVLLGAGVVAIEGLNLSEIDAGTYQLVCLPLKLAEGDGAPARAILIDLERDDIGENGP